MTLNKETLEMLTTGDSTYTRYWAGKLAAYSGEVRSISLVVTCTTPAPLKARLKSEPQRPLNIDSAYLSRN